MAVEITGEGFARVAWSYRTLKIPYSKLDCQAFVERVLSDCGITKNWRGSNHMWRTALSWRGTIDEARQKFGEVPVGAWLFTVKHDGGEKLRGYNDNDGNAVHVGIYCGADLGTMHSTTGGVQSGPWPDPKRWTHCGLCSLIKYNNPTTAIKTDTELLGIAIAALEELKGRLTVHDL